MARGAVTAVAVAVVRQRTAVERTRARAKDVVFFHRNKAMAMAMSDLYQNDELVKEVKNEYLERKGNEVYVAMVPEGPPPVNDN